MTATSNTRRIGLLLGVSALSLGLMGGAAFAQSANDGATEQVVVTGTRANLANFQAPAPTAVVGLDTINKTAATSIATALNENPAFKGLRSPQGNAQNQGSPGQATADLRGLGGQRTVVLVDGSRTVPFAPGSNLSVPTAVDLNMYPTIMIDHAEVVTGGASAQYGSDAVGGVLNLILRDRFNGVEIRGQAGESQYWDAQDERIAAIVGTDFLGGKGHFVAAFDADQNSGIGDSSKRPWAATLGNLYSNTATTTVPNPAALTAVGQPTLLNINNVRSARSTGGLLAISCPTTLSAAALAACRTEQGAFAYQNYQFLTPTGLAAYNLGTYNNGTAQVGGDGNPINQGQMLVPGVKKAELFTHTEYDLTSHIRASLDLTYAYSQGYLDASATGYDGSTAVAGMTVQPDNAYLPANVAAQVQAAKNAGYTVGFNKNDFSLGGLGAFVTNTQPRIVAGLKGDIDNFGFGENWRWDGHFSYGENEYHGNYKNAVITGGANPVTGQSYPNRLAQSFDAVVATATGPDAPIAGSGIAPGTIVCRSTLTNPKNGCIPYNFFGQQDTPGQNNSYFMSDAQNNVRYQQEDLAANLHGEPFKTWAGPVAVATGFEYRQESEQNHSDAIANDNAYNTGSDPSYQGEFAVYEGYFETNIPLADHMVFADKLNVDGAVRFASYSDAGEQTTWKVGVNYAPIDGIRFRSTESYDIRAPQIWELDAPGNGQINTLNGALHIGNQTYTALSQGIPQNSTAGSANVKPERAYTETIGVVLQPPSTWLNGWLSGLSASVDWYDIDIEGAITNTQGATALALCNTGQAFFCNMFTLGAGNTITSFLSPAINFGGVENIGYDFVLQYRKNLRDVGLPVPGRLTTAFSGTYIDHVFVNPGTGVAGSTIDRAGEAGQGNISTGDSAPHVRLNLLETYDWDKLSLYTQVLFVSQSTLDNTYNTAVTNTITSNTVPAYWKFDLGGSYQVTQHLQAFFFVNNLMNVWPARSPYSVLNTYASGAYYDKIGRALSLGFDYKY